MSSRSAGILLFKLQQQLRVLLVHPGGPLWSRKDQGAWSIPKGEYTETEDPKDAAVREFHEETGVPLSDGPLVDLGETQLKSGKRVLAWASEDDFDPAQLRSNSFEMQWPPHSGSTRQFPEIDRAEWFDPETARSKINPGQAVFIERLESILRDRGIIDAE